MHQHGGLNGALVHVRLVPKITYGGSNLQLSMFKLHKRGPQLFFFVLMATKFTLLLLSKVKLKISYSKSCILYHITYATIEALLYQPLRFIHTLKSKRNMISFGRKHCKYGMHIVGSTQHWRNNTINNKEIRQCFFDPMIYTFMMHPFQALNLSL